MLSFHRWKDEQIEKSGLWHSRDWYYQQYGNYVASCRAKKEPTHE